ncbi:hypothetical protein JCM10212_006233 [Sporobolomyces blumeae]
MDHPRLLDGSSGGIPEILISPSSPDHHLAPCDRPTRTPASFTSRGLYDRVRGPTTNAHDDDHDDPHDGRRGGLDETSSTGARRGQRPGPRDDDAHAHVRDESNALARSSQSDPPALRTPRPSQSPSPLPPPPPMKPTARVWSASQSFFASLASTIPSPFSLSLSSSSSSSSSFNLSNLLPSKLPGAPTINQPPPPLARSSPSTPSGSTDSTPRSFASFTSSTPRTGKDKGKGKGFKEDDPSGFERVEGPSPAGRSTATTTTKTTKRRTSVPGRFRTKSTSTVSNADSTRARVPGRGDEDGGRFGRVDPREEDEEDSTSSSSDSTSFATSSSSSSSSGAASEEIGRLEDDQSDEEDGEYEESIGRDEDDWHEQDEGGRERSVPGGGQVGRQSMDLRIEEATTGPSLVLDSPTPSTSSPLSPPPPSGSPKPPSSRPENVDPASSPLSTTTTAVTPQRRPGPSSASSPAFRTASTEGPVHPLTLQAIRRQDSEQEALRVVERLGATLRRRETDTMIEQNADEADDDGTLYRVRSESPVEMDEGERERFERETRGRATAEGDRGTDPVVGPGPGMEPAKGRRVRLASGGQGHDHRPARGLDEGGGIDRARDDSQASTIDGNSHLDSDVVLPPSGSIRLQALWRNPSTMTRTTTTATLGMKNRSVSTMTQASIATTKSVASTGSKKSFFSRFKKDKSAKAVSAVGGGLVDARGAGGPLGSQGPGMSTGARADQLGAMQQAGTTTTMTAGGVHRSGSVMSRATNNTVDSRGPVTPGLSEGGASSLGAGSKAEKVRFVKVKTKGKSKKEFNKLFVAQELVIPTSSTNPPPPLAPPSSNQSAGPSAQGGETDSVHSVLEGDRASLHEQPLEDDGQRSHPPSHHSHHHHHRHHHDPSSTSTHADDVPRSTTSAGVEGGDAGGAGGGGSDRQSRKSKAVWAVKFSNNGKWLAAGGRDGVVRIWEVLSTREQREAALQPPPPAPSGPSAATMRPTMPIFSPTPLREYRGHTSDVLDLNWSKNDFLLSSSMDKTVRLWHIDREECLCSFEHLDFVTSIAFHPKDDRFFLSGSLDCKLRLWNIVEKRVQVWTELPELITAVSFTRDGQYAIAGSFVGQCLFFEVETFRYHDRFTAKSSRRKDPKGKKITSLVAFPLASASASTASALSDEAENESVGADRLLVTSNDSHMRLYNTKGRFVEAKYSGHENTSSQIRASFSDDGRYIISGSEDRHVYIWNSGIVRDQYGDFEVTKKRSDGAGYESFPMPAHIITAAVFAPSTTRAVLAMSGDLIFSNDENYPHLGPFPRMGTRSSAGVGGSEFGHEEGEAGYGADDVIVVVADAETGIISILRNSRIPKAFPPPLASQASHASHPSAPSSIAGSGFRNAHPYGSTTSFGGDAVSSGQGARDKEKRWSRVSTRSR